MPALLIQSSLPIHIRPLSLRRSAAPPLAIPLVQLARVPTNRSAKRRRANMRFYNENLEGGYNKVLRLVLDDGYVEIARMSSLDPGLAKKGTASEVTTMDFVSFIKYLQI